MKHLTGRNQILGTLMGVGTTALVEETLRYAAGGRAPSQDSSTSVTVPAGAGWFARLLDRLDDRAREAQTRQQEAYLAGAADLCDLEARMRRIDLGPAHGDAAPF